MGTKSIDSTTEASHIYDSLYGKIATRKISNATKSARIEKILATMTFEEKTVLRACCKYGDMYMFNIASKVTGIELKKFKKIYKMARRHMYSPNNIRIAVPGFYNLKIKKQHNLDKYDFGGQQYIITYLNKSGIDTIEKLFKHLSLGWYYLWTIPGCGPNAIQSILIAIDHFEAAGFSRDCYKKAVK